MKPEYRDSDPLDAESLLSDSNTSTDDTSRIHHRQPWPRKFPTLAIIVILTISHICVAIAASLATHQFTGQRWWSNKEGGGGNDINEACARLVSHSSPITTDLDISWSPITYNGSFFHQTPFRGDASPEVDEAWESLGVDFRAARIHEDEAAAAGLTVDHVKIREEYGGGYPANVEGLHHLHCLNLLRQGLVYNYDYYKALGKGAFKNDEPIVKYHITHCLDIIRQQLMCTVDTGVLGQVWWNTTSPKPFVDFNTEHQCKNFEAVRQWAEERQLPASTPNDYLERPAGKVYAEIP